MVRCGIQLVHVQAGMSSCNFPRDTVGTERFDSITTQYYRGGAVSCIYLAGSSWLWGCCSLTPYPSLLGRFLRYYDVGRFLRLTYRDVPLTFPFLHAVITTGVQTLSISEVESVMGLFVSLSFLS